MTSCHDLRERASFLMDNDLPDADREALDAHLAGCVGCRGFIEDLDRVRRAAASLGPVAPPESLWLRIEGRVRLDTESVVPANRAHRRVAVGRWMGMAAALVVFTLGGWYFAWHTPASNVPVRLATTGSVEGVAEELSRATEHYERAIAELESIARTDSGTLDPALAETLRQNMQTIDLAIDESRTALIDNPGSEPARDSLFDALRRKVVVLQATVNLMNEMRDGTQGAVDAAVAFGEKS